MPAWSLAAGIAVLFLGVAGFAKATGHWESPIPNSPNAASMNERGCVRLTARQAQAKQQKRWKRMWRLFRSVGLSA